MNKAEMISVLCVDDHPVVLEGLAAIISGEDDMAVVAEAGNGQAAIDQYREHTPDVVVMDLRMPSVGGVEATALIRKEFPDARIIVMTTYEGDENIHRALAAGAQGYLLKDTVRQDLLHTIRDVVAGKRYVSPRMAARVAENTPRIALSPRELEVLRLVAEGLRNKEIGGQLNIAEDTVRIHMGNILSKLKVADRTQAVVSAMQRGIIHLNSPH